MSHKSAGFTLIELAVVLLIVSLLLGGLLVPLSTQIGQRNIQQTQTQLDEIREALLGFAVVNGRLPCPTTTADPTNANYGLEDANCTAPASEGYLPWKTLGVAAYDAWGVGRNATADPWTGYFRYRVHPNFADSTKSISMSTDFKISGTTRTLTVQDAAGNALTSSSEPPVAIVYSTGANTKADGQNATYELMTASPTYQGGQFINDTNSPNYFDDLTIWVSRPLLYNRLIAAGRIP